MSDSPSPSQALAQSRGWLFAGGVLSIIVGFLAMGAPALFSFVIAQFLGAFALVSGVISLFLAIFGKHVAHRVLDAVLMCVASSVAVITLILAIFLMVEGVSFIVGAIQMRAHVGWIWTLINGIAALVLGLMVSVRWPGDSIWVLGLFYGINSIFWGVSLLMLGLGANKPAAA
jgi:uncharacterized membrane protein HdeD (DUF308 family)